MVCPLWGQLERDCRALTDASALQLLLVVLGEHSVVLSDFRHSVVPSLDPQLASASVVLQLGVH